MASAWLLFGLFYSCGLEIIADCPDVDVVVVCCGGGGILAGVAAAVKRSTQTAGSPVFGRNIRIYGVEPEGGEDGCA